MGRSRKLPPENGFDLREGQPNALVALTQQSLAQRLIDRFPPFQHHGLHSSQRPALREEPVDFPLEVTDRPIKQA